MKYRYPPRNKEKEEDEDEEEEEVLAVSADRFEQ